jgi:mono/diheme cytochrome c family protein
MRARENYTLFFATGFGLTIAIAVIFQLYLLREPDRIQTVLEADHAAAVEFGRQLYADNCTSCHGKNGEGGVGSALNSQDLLSSVLDEALFNITRTGIPGSKMPAWGQVFGGPFTDEQISHLVSFIRAWEPTAPKIEQASAEPDPIRGATLYASTCFICHGENGVGTDNAPALNDLERLQRFDDPWYRATIANGRPAKGMPTWGTVLSPEQISDLVALINAWREGEIVQPQISLSGRVGSALFAVRQFDQLDAVFHLSAALTQAEDANAASIQQAVDLIKDNRLFEAEALLISMFPPEEMGQELFTTNCTGCHGADGSGGTGPNLYNNPFIQSKNDQELVDFILVGRPGTAMNGFEGTLTPEDLLNLVALMRTWQ